jgi:hypothetical protein
MAFRAKLYSALKPKLMKWHSLSADDNLEELALLFSDFAKRELAPSLLLKMLGLQREVLDSEPRPDGHLISFETTSRLFLSGVQASDTLEELQAVLEKHISRLEACRQEAKAAPALVQTPPQRPKLTIPAQPRAASTPPSGLVGLQPPSPMCSISASIISSDQGDERHHGLSAKENAKRRDAERLQERCRYSLMLASREDGAAVGNATIRTMCENLRQPSPVVVKRTLDELELLLSSQHVRLEPEWVELLLAPVLELLFVADRHLRRRAMSVLKDLAPKGDARVLDILCPKDARGVSLGLADEDQFVRVLAVRVCVCIYAYTYMYTRTSS